MNFNAKNTRPHRSTKEKIVIAVCGALLLVITLFLRSCSSEEPFIPNLSENSTIWDGQQNQKKKADQGYIEMPYFGNLYVNEDEPYVWLNNPEMNDVYFQYNVIAEDGSKVFDEDAYVEPGKAIQVDFYSLFEKGTYKLTIEISAVDVNGNACNGSTQEVKLVVE